MNPSFEINRSHIDTHAEDVSMVISPSDFPGDERLADILISEMKEEYLDDAKMASMTFCRGSVLMQEAQEFTRDMVDGYLGI